MIARAAGRIEGYARAHPWSIDVALLALLTACAAALRLPLLGDLPYGVHGDEAQVGLDAHRVLRDGWIGVYTHAALGQPSGHAYLTAPSIWLLGDTAFALRLPLALVGVAQIPLLYLLVRLLANRLEATLAAALLTISYWQLFYSRVAHWSISYATVLLAAMLCLALAMRGGRQRRASCSASASTPTTSTQSSSSRSRRSSPSRRGRATGRRCGRGSRRSPSCGPPRSSSRCR